MAYWWWLDQNEVGNHMMVWYRLISSVPRLDMDGMMESRFVRFSFQKSSPESRNWKKKGSLNKCDVYGGVKFLWRWGITLVPFSIWRMAQKNAFCGLWVKFVFMLGMNVDKYRTAEEFEGDVVQ